MKLFFNLFVKLFSKRLDNYIFERTINDVAYQFNEKQEEYLKTVAAEGVMKTILDTIDCSVVATGLTSQDMEGIRRRNNWRECLSYLKKQIDARRPKLDIKANPLTNEPPKK